MPGKGPVLGETYDNKKYPRYTEVDARFLFETGLLETENGEFFLYDESVGDDLCTWCNRSDEDDITEALKIAENIQAKYEQEGNESDYCRGHDLTYFLAKLLQSIEGCPAPATCRELENKIVKRIFAKDEYEAKFQQELSRIELFKKFGKS